MVSNGRKKKKNNKNGGSIVTDKQKNENEISSKPSGTSGNVVPQNQVPKNKKEISKKKWTGKIPFKPSTQKDEGQLDNREMEQEKEAARLEEEKLLRQDREQRVMKKNRLESQIQLMLGGGTGILAIWDHLVLGITTGSITTFKTLAPKFVKKVEDLNEIVEEYDAMKSISSDPKEDLLTMAFDRELKSRKLIAQVNENAEKLKASGFWGEQEIDPERLLEWYQQAID